MKTPFGRFSSLRFTVPLKILAFISVCFIAGFFVRPLRNFVLRPVWPKIWEEVSSIDLIMMTRDYTVPSVTDLEFEKCPKTVSPNVSISEVRLTTYVSSSKSEVHLKDPSHRYFLPWITDDEKLQLLHLYLIVAEALNNIGVKYFFMDGSVLGIARHGGFVPWDDDIDIAMNVTEWQRVRDALSCINGYRLDTKPIMHWKFYKAHSPRGYPYIDIFFYTENDYYLWAIPHYIKYSMVFLKADVFPLKTVHFENLLVPVPVHDKRLADLIFGLDSCQSPSVNHKTGETFEVVSVPCSALTYLYNMEYSY